MAQRQLYRGSAEELAFAICPHADRADFIKFDEKSNSKVQIAAILQARELWKSLQALQGNLSFPRLVTEAALDR
eukprot:182370-Alexandrium_andersonii.AAC.1